MGKTGAIFVLGERKWGDRNLRSSNVFFGKETCSGILRFHSTLFIWKKSTFFITPLLRRNPTLGENSFQSHVLLDLVVLAHSGLRSQLGIVGPNRSLAPEMLWNIYKVSSEAGDEPISYAKIAACHQWETANKRIYLFFLKKQVKLLS